MRILLLAILATVVSGCAASPDFVRRDTDWVTYMRDYGSCKSEVSGLMKRGAMFNDRDDAVIESCMRSRGYCLAGKVKA